MAMDRRLLLLSPDDNVLVARCDIPAGEILHLDAGELTLQTDIELGHKIARSEISLGQIVLKYGAPIGSATADISPGSHVHLHNMKSDFVAFDVHED